MRAAGLITALATLLLTTSVLGHELRPSLLALQEVAPGEFDVSVRVSVAGPSRVHLSPVFPEHCRELVAATVTSSAGAEVKRSRIACGAPLGGERVTIDGLRGSVNDVLVRIETLEGAVQTARVLPEAPFFLVAVDQAVVEIAWTYAVLGTQHILLGLDHLLFVLALMLLIRSARVLVATITAFTVAHSITLALSALGLANAPQPLVEALVALSIVFVAVEIVSTKAGDRAQPSLAPWKIAFAFGLLHGLGFGGALNEIGIPAGDVPLALLAFNLGVEAGQLLVVALALLTAASLRLLLAIPLASARFWLGYGIGGVSATWFAQRVMVLGS